jgi:hypothetical protein
LGEEIRIKNGAMYNAQGNIIAICKLKYNLYKLGITYTALQIMYDTPNNLTLDNVDLSNLRLGHINQTRLQSLVGLTSFNE